MVPEEMDMTGEAWITTRGRSDLLVFAVPPSCAGANGISCKAGAMNIMTQLPNDMMTQCICNASAEFF
jgi:hypothetical protein